MRNLKKKSAEKAQKQTPAQPVALTVLIGDTHCFSQFGLCPENFEDQNGFAYAPRSETLRDTWQCWLDATGPRLEALTRGDPFNIIFMGDMIEGNHHRTLEIGSPDEGLHLKMAEQVLRPIRDKARKAFMIRGTECHTKNYEHVLGEALRCERDPETGLFCFDTLFLEQYGCLIMAKHHMPTSGREWTAASGLGIHAAQGQLSRQRVAHPVPKVIISAHRHVPGVFDAQGVMVVCTPSWQRMTRHAHKVVPMSVSTIGMIVLDWRGRRWGDEPGHHKFFYPPKAPTILQG